MQSHGRQDDIIPIQVRDLKQLFDSRDPAPFFERDLDDDAAEYIIDSLVDLGRNAARIEITFTTLLSDLDEESLRTAIHRHFEYQLRRQSIRHRQLLKEGFAALILGLLILVFLSMGVSKLPLPDSSPTTTTFHQGLMILGWVVLWRPFDILVYSWWPFLSNKHVLQKLTKIPINIRIKLGEKDGYRKY